MKLSTILLVVVALCMLQYSDCEGDAISKLDASVREHFEMYNAIITTAERIFNTSIEDVLNYITKITHGGKNENPCVTEIIAKINALSPQLVLDIVECENAASSNDRDDINAILVNINDLLVDVATGGYCVRRESKGVLNKTWKDGLRGNRCNELEAIPETIVNYLAEIIDISNIQFPFMFNCNGGLYRDGISEVFVLLGELHACSQPKGYHN